MTKKQILRCTAFLLIAVSLMFPLCTLFEQGHGSNTDKTFHTYRELEEDTVDAVFIGTSGVGCYWIAPLAYEEYGMTVYPLSSDAMPSWLYTNMIDEALTYQDPELILLDIRPFTSSQPDREYMDTWARVILDSMDTFSLNRLRVAFKTMKTIHSVHEEAPRWDISYLFNFVKYHSRWSEEGYRISYHLDETVHHHNYAGFHLSADFTANVQPLEPFVYDDTAVGELAPLHEAALYELLDYIREMDLNVLFVDTPKVLTEVTMERTNRIYQILEEEGFDCVSYLTTSQDGSFSIDLDHKTDFFNANHVNYYGADKFTRAFAAYLDEQYDLPDRRDDASVQNYWDGLYDDIVTAMTEIEAQIAAEGQSEAANMPAGE